jgi:hypothetical protein
MDAVSQVAYGRLLIDLLHAIVTDDERLFMSLVTLPPKTRLHHLIPYMRLANNDPYINYFFFSESSTSIVLGVVLFDHPILREAATAYGLQDLVFFGPNQDPVILCTAATIVGKLIHVSKDVAWGDKSDREVLAPRKVHLAIERYAGGPQMQHVESDKDALFDAMKEGDSFETVRPRVETPKEVVHMHTNWEGADDVATRWGQPTLVPLEEVLQTRLGPIVRKLHTTSAGKFWVARIATLGTGFPDREDTRVLLFNAKNHVEDDDVVEDVTSLLDHSTCEGDASQTVHLVGSVIVRTSM